ncbi:DUF4126 domain-containing protein [Lusitaniella coriacea LEGE 07157]|uniref:DUF4126 domain-containing protein n=2 Tax=Lusitaniella TaxID=1983104 RepID=A0A8J7IXG6_9CYAN|nr:DUF4126 domain-containing protein [Lusitaniella coriacea LEGE 07157]
METLLAICLGIALSSACGFRIFIPPLVMSVAALQGNLPLAPGFEWIGTYPAFLVFAIAVIVEIVAYYLPVASSFLDEIEIPIAIVMGTIVVASLLGEIDPFLQWTIAALIGGGAAGIIEGINAIDRVASSRRKTAADISLNSTIEVLSATLLSVLALRLPLFTGLLAVSLLAFSFNQLSRFWVVETKK